MSQREAHQPLPAGWTVSEDSHGRIYFINTERGYTQWGDPRIPEAEFMRYEQMVAPTVVKAGFMLYDIQQKGGFFNIREELLRRVVEKHEGTDSKSFIRKKDFEDLAAQTLDTNPRPGAAKITDRLFSLLDLKYENEVEFRVALLGLIFLSPLKTYRKIQFAFLVLDTTRKGRLNQELLFVMFKTITRLVENQRFRYKLAMSNRNLVGDVTGCLNAVQADDRRPNDGTITFPEFVRFAIEDPLIIRALSMLEKIQRSRESVHHGKKCKVCNESPIIGIRYKITDTKFNMCEKCFWKGLEVGQFSKDEAVTEYPAKHKKSRVVKDAISGRFLPIIKFFTRVPDEESRRPEYLDAQGNLVSNPILAAPAVITTTTTTTAAAMPADHKRPLESDDEVSSSELTTSSGSYETDTDDSTDDEN